MARNHALARLAAPGAPELPEVLKRAADVAVMPRWRALGADDVRAKSSPDDLVTVADVEAERLITEALHSLAPGVPVVGEEAVAADPALLTGRAALPAYWLVDPIDGTGNFVEGSPDFGVMAALVEDGVTTASWIWLPVTGVLASASLGGGAWLDGVRIDATSTPPRDVADLYGWIAVKYLPDEVRARITPEAKSRLDERPPMSAAIGYVRMLAGESDAALFWRSYPWDHVPGALLLAESGGAVRHLDGTPYLPGVDRLGLLSARDVRSWEPVRDLVFADAHL